MQEYRCSLDGVSFTLTSLVTSAVLLFGPSFFLFGGFQTCRVEVLLDIMWAKMHPWVHSPIVYILQKVLEVKDKYLDNVQHYGNVKVQRSGLQHDKNSR